jgi:Na+-transporting NADH:ubiquinone oxidoreductase subunit A
VGRDDLGSLDRNFVQHRLLDSGLWPAFRSRPFDRIPPPDDIPAAILVTAIDTNPLAADPVTVIAPRMDAFIDGLHVLGKLTSRLCLCKAHGLRLDSAGLPKIEIVEFSGPHPAGLPGTHVACLAPASEVHSVWHLGYQDVIAIGEHFVSGRIPTERVVAVGGPGALQPRLLRTRVGAALDELLAGAIAPAARVIAGSLLSGREPEPMTAFLGPYETQVSVLKKDADDIVPAAGRVTKFFESVFGTSSVMMPLERFERLWPLPHPVLPLLRALLTGDVDRAAELGCLDLAEEDLALCSYLCPGRQDYGTALRKVLRELESDLLD